MGSLDRDDNEDALPPSAGPNPNKGIMYYKAIDLANGVFAKWRIATGSSARVALGDFNGKGNLDVASINYNVVGYYEEPDPCVTVHMNEIVQQTSSQNPSMLPSLWDGEGIVYLADPSLVVKSDSMALIEIANIAISIEIYPPGDTVPIGEGEGVKVLYGTLEGASGTRKPLGGAPFPATASTTSSNETLEADSVQGAIILRMTPVPGTSESEWPDASKVPVKTTFDLSKVGLTMPSLIFTKVEDLWWGEPFKGREFYNLSGFHFRFLESKTHIAHIQFWIADTGVSAGAHNHSNDYFEEIHVDLSLGTGDGGMSQINEEHEDATQEEAEALPASAYTHKVLPPLYEHGRMWKTDADGNAIRGKNNVVVYPWHKWQAGTGSNVDVWLAHEFNPDLFL
ncbi:hypothetical protein F5B20DRAFT_50631 [Whalleya microplaca]|nr:hypothetical protein F5B20DRAFT_50631 [Whalleya microplaca]